MKLRLALREEGGFWNAYLARIDTMVDARLIGSIAIGAVNKNPEVKEVFQALMQKVMADGIEELTGSPPDAWDVRPASEPDRGGHA